MARRLLQILLLCGALWAGGLAWAQAAGFAAPVTCPPQASQPTPEQMQAAAGKAQDRGMLWRISRDGRSSYLYATIHLGKLEWAFPGTLLREALQATDTLALELDLTDPQTQARMTPPASAARPALPEALKKRIDEQIANACVPDRQAFAAQHPVMQALGLTALDARWTGLDISYAQEFVLAGYAQALKRPVVSLETPELQLQALLPTQEAEALALIERALQDLESGKSRKTMARMAGAWEAGRLEELADYAQWCECIHDDRDRAFYKRLNDGRNPQLAERIAALHAQGKQVLAAVGALHMTGDQALPKLMAERGFKVERLARR